MMPIYEYKRVKCENKFGELFSVDTGNPACNSCSAGSCNTCGV